MRRLHLVELEDLPWWPAVIRDFATDYLGFMQSRFELHTAMVPLLANAMRLTRSERIVDLCSGSGGPIEAIVRALHANGLTVTVTLTDRFPNLRAMVDVSARSSGAITFEHDAIDARAVPERLDGFRTLFNSMHHFRPTELAAAPLDLCDTACAAHLSLGRSSVAVARI